MPCFPEHCLFVLAQRLSRHDFVEKRIDLRAFNWGVGEENKKTARRGGKLPLRAVSKVKELCPFR